MHDVVLIENKDTFSAAACDISIVFIGALPCFSSFTCRRVIVWYVVCCASLILALKNTCLCSLLTLCLASSESYEKRACHKTTIHINRLGSLVETVAAMSHDLCTNKSLFTQLSTVWRIVQFIQSWLSSMDKASCAHWTIVHCSGWCVAERAARSDCLSDAPYQQQSRTVSLRVARLWLHTRCLSSEWMREAGWEEKKDTENLRSFKL